jgi:uncharacterized protein (TIGR02757 family)
VADSENKQAAINTFLDACVKRYNKPRFLESDPVQIPHRFTIKQDIEIAGFWTSILSWGYRKTIITKALKLIELMDNCPYDFIKHHTESDRVRFQNFKHRTFQYTDSLYFLEFLQQYYREHESLEWAFSFAIKKEDTHVENGLRSFHDVFFSLPYFPERTKKHIPTPQRNSTCKRLNMFLRWMVRDDTGGVDFGIWRSIKPHQLVVPLDVHVNKVARKLGLLQRNQTDWKAALELTGNLKTFDRVDPVKYDYALFGVGVMEPHLLETFIQKKSVPDQLSFSKRIS